MSASGIDWHLRARKLIHDGQIVHQAFIDGTYKSAGSGETFGCISPIDGAELAQVAACNESDIDAAVTAARRSFEQGSWSQATPSDRKKTLLRFAELVEAHKEELALLETLDMGKPIRYS